jgi:hypothetical protein
MFQCPRCGKFTLENRSDILPPPLGTNWLPLPRKWVECSNCGYDSRPGHGVKITPIKPTQPKRELSTAEKKTQQKNIYVVSIIIILILILAISYLVGNSGPTVSPTPTPLTESTAVK